MASFFQRQIAKKIIPFFKCKENSAHVSAKILSSIIKVNRFSKSNPELLLPWRKFLKYSPDVESWMTLPNLAKLLKNQGVPTAEGIVDIHVNDSPLGLAFSVDKHVFSKIVLTEICENEEEMLTESCYFHNVSPQKTLVYLSLGSVGDVFSMTDFRKSIHSSFIENINKFVGNEAEKVHVVADWNFKSALLLAGFKKLGNREKLLANPTSHLFEVLKVADQLYRNDLSFQSEIQACFENFKKHSSEWSHFRCLHLKQNSSLFEKLGISSENVRFDSTYTSEIVEVYQELLAKNLISDQKNGTVKLNFINCSEEESSSHNEISKSLAYRLCSAVHFASQTEANQNYDVIYFVAPKSEEIFFLSLVSLLKKLDSKWSEKLHFIGLNNSDGFNIMKKKRLSIEEIENQAKSLMLKNLKTGLYLEPDENLGKVAESLSYSSLILNDLKHRRNSKYYFDWDEVLSLGKNSGAAFQLCHAGLKGMLEENEILVKVDIDTSPLLEHEAQSLIFHLARFDEMVYRSYITLEPSFLHEYLSSLWYHIDRATNVLKLDLKSDRLIVIKARLLLLSAALNILQKCLNILGVEPYVNEYSQPKF